jgi:hypothetical protein
LLWHWQPVPDRKVLLAPLALLVLLAPKAPLVLKALLALKVLLVPKVPLAPPALPVKVARWQLAI